MSFESILYSGTVGGELSESPPEWFADLGLDVVVASLTRRREDFGVDRLWHTPPARVEDARYRQEVFADLEDSRVLGSIREFAEALRTVLAVTQEAEDRACGHQWEGIFVGAVLSYCGAVLKLLDSLSHSRLKSTGLTEFRRYLEGYVSSEGFRRLKSEGEAVSSQIASLSFCMDVRGSSVTVYGCEGGEDYGAFVEELFDRFRGPDGGVAEPKWRLTHVRGHVEAVILDLAAKLYPEPFRRLSRFYAENRGFVDRVVLRFYREAQFYLSYLDYILPLKEAGLAFCIPRFVQEERGEVFCAESFDLALASKIVREGGRVVTNDLRLGPGERVVVVTGPNSGGKTTFARMVGQLHYLAKLGVPVPGREAALVFVDEVYTHFPRGEDVENMRGKLEEELVRIKRILDSATSRSVVVINELFGSTSTADAALLGRRVIERIQWIGCLCVYVTFVDELASAEHVVSCVAQVDPRDPKTRTFKVVRQRADGLAYARLIAEKYRLTYKHIVSRVAP